MKVLELWTLRCICKWVGDVMLKWFQKSLPSAAFARLQLIILRISQIPAWSANDLRLGMCASHCKTLL